MDTENKIDQTMTPDSGTAAVAVTTPADKAPEDQATEKVAAQPDAATLAAENESLKKQIADAQSFIGKQSNKVGTLEKLYQQQAQKQAELEHYLQQQANPPRDWEAEINQVAAQVDEGLPPGEAMRRTAQIVYERTKAESLQETAGLIEQQERQARMRQMENDWINKNPDYLDFLQSGEREKLAAEHPFYNDSPFAFKEFKLRQAEAKAAAKFEEGKRIGIEETKRLLQGTAKGQNVLQDPGSAASRVAPAPLTLEQKRARFVERYNAGEFRK